jgi:Ca-activated chloride channel family protein
MIDNISFEYPYIFAIIIIYIVCTFYCKAKSPTYIIPHLDLFENSAIKSKIILIILKFSIILFILIALASPVKTNQTQLVQDDGINIVLNLDASGSMKHQDLDQENSKNRFEVVKEIVSDFIEKRIYDNIALVVFGDAPMLASPLSFDKKVQQEILTYLEIGVAGERTSLYDSIASSINILKNKKAKSNIIIVLSDGQDTNSSIPLNIIIKLLKKYNIKVYTIGIGSSNKLVLNEIAKVSKGDNFTIYNKKQLQLVYEKINTLEKSKINKNKIILKGFLFFYPLFLAIILLLLYIYIKNKE